MSDIYSSHDIWLTIDVEEITDTNFNLKWKHEVKLDYDKLIDNWIELNVNLNMKSTCFVLGSFAKKYPSLIKRLSDAGHEIASHGNNHNLVYAMTLKEWENSIIDSKNILEEITGKTVKGYRSASWSLPFEKRYYEILAKHGYSYSSSYFPMKTYMYGNSINKKCPFNISTQNGTIKEIPIIKSIVPFSGGFYLRVIPCFIEKYFFRKLINKGNKPIVYLHPYELLNDNLIQYFKKHLDFNLDFLLTFYSSSNPLKKIINIFNGLK
jgi:polysaccharide deacetylase family protein (PEP-CTERM system associated)